MGRTANATSKTTAELLVFCWLLACMQASEGEGKKKDERVKREKIGRGRIAIGDACKDAIVFFIPPLINYAKPTQLWNVWLSKLSNQNHATAFVTKSVGATAFSYVLFLLFCVRK